MKVDRQSGVGLVEQVASILKREKVAMTLVLLLKSGKNIILALEKVAR